MSPNHLPQPKINPIHPPEFGQFVDESIRQLQDIEYTSIFTFIVMFSRVIHLLPLSTRSCNYGAYTLACSICGQDIQQLQETEYVIPQFCFTVIFMFSIIRVVYTSLVSLLTCSLLYDNHPYSPPPGPGHT